MDTFTFMISLLIMMMAVQFGQIWLIFAIVALMVLTMRDISTIILIVSAAAVLVLGRDYLMDYWPFILFGFIILSVAISRGQKSQEADYPEMFGAGEMGGIGFGGGY